MGCVPDGPPPDCAAAGPDVGLSFTNGTLPRLLASLPERF